MPAAPPALPDSRRQILDVAEKHFLLNGYERTSMDALAAAAQVSKQTLYAFFPSKAALFETAVLGAVQEIAVPTADVDEQDESVTIILARFARRLFDVYSAPINLGLFRASIVLTAKQPLFTQALHVRRIAAGAAMTAYMERLIERGLLPPADPTLTGVRFGGLCIEGSRYLLGEPPPAAAARNSLASAAADLMAYGIRDAAPPSPPEAMQEATLPVPDSPGPASRLSPAKVRILFEAATAEFLERGYVRGSVDRIVTASGIGRATIYRQFGSKEGLFRTVIERAIAEVAADRLPIEEDAPLKGALAALAHVALDRHLAPRSIALHRVLVEEAAAFPELARAFYRAQVDRVGAPLETLLARHGRAAPTPFARRAFHTLATFGTRFLVLVVSISTDERRALANEAAALFLGAGARRDPGM